MPVCPKCGKNVRTMVNGQLRPHQVPIEKRKVPTWSEKCGKPWGSA